MQRKIFWAVSDRTRGGLSSAVAAAKVVWELFEELFPERPDDPDIQHVSSSFSNTCDVSLMRNVSWVRVGALDTRRVWPGVARTMRERDRVTT